MAIDAEGQAPEAGQEGSHDDPGQGSPHPNDGRQWVPLDRAERMAANAAERVRQELEAELAEVRSKMEKGGEGNQQQSAPEYTRAQLQAMVDQGQIDTLTMETVLDNQREARIKRETQETMRAELAKNQKQAQVYGEIAQYTTKIPELTQVGTEQRNRVQAEFNSLVAMGMDKNDPVTELAALKAVFGRAATLETPGERVKETHQETGSDLDDDSEGQTNKDGSPKGLSSAERKYYQSLIDKRIYKDWKQVNDELKFANAELRTRKAAQYR